MWNPGNHCKICYKLITGNEFAENEETDEDRRKILNFCIEYLFTELCDWKCINFKETLPFCSECSGVIQKICALDETYKREKKNISDFSEVFAVKVLRLRNKPQQEIFPKIIGGATIKTERGVEQELMCKICHGMYNDRPVTENESLNLGIVTKVIRICKKYLFSEIFDDGSLDVEVIARLNLLPFCLDCCISIQDICQKDDLIESLFAEIESFVNTFAVQILNYRKNRKSIGRPEEALIQASLLTPDNSFRTAETPPVVQEEENEEECMVVDVIPKGVEMNVYNSLCDKLKGKTDASCTPVQPTRKCCPPAQSTPLVGQYGQGTQHLHSDRRSLPRMSDKVLYPVTPVIEETVNEGDKEVNKDNCVDRDMAPRALIFSDETPGPSTKITSNRTTLKGNYECQNCGVGFMHQLNWLKHIDSCFTDANLFECETCGESFSDAAYFTRHVNSHSIPGNSDNPSATEVTQHLNVPQKRHFPSKTVKFNSHQRVQIKSYKCPRCNRCFTRRNHLTNHAKGNLCHSVDNFKQLSRQSVLSQRRIRTSKKKSIRRVNRRGFGFSCSMCPMTFTLQPIFTSHLQTHFDIASVRKRCDICRKVFTTVGYRNIHFAKVHPEKIDQNSEKNPLDQDMPQLNAEQQNPTNSGFSPKRKRLRKRKIYSYTCTVCEKIFTRKYLMRRHMLRDHYEQTLTDGNGEHQVLTDPDYSLKRKRQKKIYVYNFTCTICEKIFTRKYMLRGHMLRAHNAHILPDGTVEYQNPADPEYSPKGKKKTYSPLTQEIIQNGNRNANNAKRSKSKRFITKYTCAICALRFGKIMELRSHLQTHYGEALYRCTTCKLVVNNQRSLFRHMDSVHAGQYS